MRWILAIVLVVSAISGQWVAVWALALVLVALWFMGRDRRG